MITSLRPHILTFTHIGLSITEILIQATNLRQQLRKSLIGSFTETSIRAKETVFFGPLANLGKSIAIGVLRSLVK